MVLFYYNVIIEKQKWLQLGVFSGRISYKRNQGFGTTKLGVIFKLNQQFLRGKSYQKSQVVDLVRASWNQIIEDLKLWQRVLQPATPSL